MGPPRGRKPFRILWGGLWIAHPLMRTGLGAEGFIRLSVVVWARCGVKRNVSEPDQAGKGFLLTPPRGRTPSTSRHSVSGGCAT